MVNPSWYGRVTERPGNVVISGFFLYTQFLTGLRVCDTKTFSYADSYCSEWRRGPWRVSPQRLKTFGTCLFEAPPPFTTGFLPDRMTVRSRRHRRCRLPLNSCSVRSVGDGWECDYVTDLCGGELKISQKCRTYDLSLTWMTWFWRFFSCILPTLKGYYQKGITFWFVWTKT